MKHTAQNQRSVLFLTLCLLQAPYAGAHPGSGIVVNTESEVFFTHGNTVIKVSRSGHPSVLVNDSKGEMFYQLHHLVLSDGGDLLTASDSGTGIWRISQEGMITRHYPALNRSAWLVVGVGGAPFAIDEAGNILTVNLVYQLTSQIIRLSVRGEIQALTGGPWGHRDGSTEFAQFGDLHSSSMTMHPDGNLLLTDQGKYVRSVGPDGEVRTLAGHSSDNAADQKADEPHFSALRGIAVDSHGEIFVADSGSEPNGGGKIYRIEQEGGAILVAGGGKPGSLEGPALQVDFTQPTGLSFGPDGGLYILEPTIPRIRKLTKQGQIYCILNGMRPGLKSPEGQAED